jgi:hypothetical protein
MDWVSIELLSFTVFSLLVLITTQADKHRLTAEGATNNGNI